MDIIIIGTITTVDRYSLVWIAEDSKLEVHSLRAAMASVATKKLRILSRRSFRSGMKAHAVVDN